MQALDEDSYIDNETDIYLAADIPGGGKRAKAVEESEQVSVMVYAPTPMESDCDDIKVSNLNKELVYSSKFAYWF